MDVRGDSSMMIGVTFSVETSFQSLMEEGGVDEFAKLARERLEQELEPLRALQVMKRITEAAANNKSKQEQAAK